MKWNNVSIRIYDDLSSNFHVEERRKEETTAINRTTLSIRDNVIAIPTPLKIILMTISITRMECNIATGDVNVASPNRKFHSKRRSLLFSWTTTSRRMDYETVIKISFFAGDPSGSHPLYFDTIGGGDFILTLLLYRLQWSRA